MRRLFPAAHESKAMRRYTRSARVLAGSRDIRGCWHVSPLNGVPSNSSAFGTWLSQWVLVSVAGWLMFELLERGLVQLVAWTVADHGRAGGSANPLPRCR